MVPTRKGKAVTVLPITHYAVKTYGRVDVAIQVFWTSTLAGGEWSASPPG
jgi:hypothetical protein